MASVQSTCIRFLLRRVNLWNKPIGEIRKELEKAKTKGMPDEVSVENTKVNGVGCYVLIPNECVKSKAILYFHGGGCCLGIYPTNLAFAARMAKECGVKVVVPDFRLAPEHPFPAALTDAVSVYQGVLQDGYKASNIVVAGDSSGCGLLLSALLRLKESGAEMPAAISMITPVLDFAGQGESFQTRVKKDPFRMKDPLGVAKVYIGANDPFSPDISPLYGNMAGLPPVLVHGADYDVFLSDAVRLEEVCRRVGVKIELKIWPKLWHIFHMQDTFVPEARDAVDEMCAHMRTRLK